MIYRNNFITFLSILAEASYFFLPYVLLAELCKAYSSQQISLSGLILIVTALSVFNIILALRPKRRITVILLNIGLIVITTLLTLGYMGFFKGGGSLSIFYTPQNIWLSLQAWLVLIFIAIMAIRAMLISSRQIYLKAAIKRFEISIGVFLVTAILAGLLNVELKNGFLIIIAGLISNFLAISLCKPIEHLSGRYLLAGTLALILFLGTIMAVLNWQQAFLINLSTWIYNSTIPLLGGTFVNFLRWLLTKGKYIQNDTRPGEVPSNEGVITGLELSLPDVQWLKYLVWFLMGVVILLFAAILIILLVYLIKYLLKPNSDKSLPEDLLERELSFFSILGIKIKNIISKINMLLVIYLSKDISVEKLYGFLLWWGERKDMPRLHHETPYEYSHRLGLKYPQQREYIKNITEAYVAYEYGNIKQNRETLENLNNYLKKLYFNHKINR